MLSDPLTNVRLLIRTGGRVTTSGSQPRAELFELADENGTVYWLDLSTGSQLTTESRRATRPLTYACAQREAQLLAPVITVFAQHGYELDPSSSTLNVRIAGRAATYDVGIFANGDREIVCSYTFVPTPVPLNRRAAVAEAMTFINARIWIGNFEMDCEDGYMRFRLNAQLEDGELTLAAAERLVHDGALAWDENYCVLMQ